MWIDDSQCDNRFHILGRDDQDKWTVVHNDDSVCLLVELGGDADERIRVAVPDLDEAARIKKARNLAA